LFRRGKTDDSGEGLPRADGAFMLRAFPVRSLFLPFAI